MPTGEAASSSPLPVEVTMSFPDAMHAIINGKKITRKAWPEGEYGVLEDAFLMIYKNGQHYWTVSEGDLVANDWVTL